MFRAFRVALGFLIAYAVFAPHSLATHFETPWMANVKAQLVAAHPADKLRGMAEDALDQLRGKQAE
jgi:hypothetical protein